MGLPVGEPLYGQTCSICTPAPFPDHKTPQALLVHVEEIVRCVGFPDDPEAPNGDYIITQKLDEACAWINPIGSVPGVWYRSYTIGPDPFTYLFVVFPGLPEILAFSADSSGACLLTLHSTLNCYNGDHYSGGIATVTPYIEPIPPKITETMGFHPGEGNLYEKTPTIANMADYRLANKVDKTNCLFRIDTNAI